jgi:hypothetical protein
MTKQFASNLSGKHWWGLSRASSTVVTGIIVGRELIKPVGAPSETLPMSLNFLERESVDARIRERERQNEELRRLNDELRRLLDVLEQCAAIAEADNFESIAKIRALSRNSAQQSPLGHWPK